MKAEVVWQFTDKLTGKIHPIGEVVDMDAERVERLCARGVLKKLTSLEEEAPTLIEEEAPTHTSTKKRNSRKPA